MSERPIVLIEIELGVNSGFQFFLTVVDGRMSVYYYALGSFLKILEHLYVLAGHTITVPHCEIYWSQISKVSNGSWNLEATCYITI